VRRKIYFFGAEKTKNRYLLNYPKFPSRVSKLVGIFGGKFRPRDTSRGLLANGYLLFSEEGWEKMRGGEEGGGTGNI
jgi:hypothetical protein